MKNKARTLLVRVISCVLIFALLFPFYQNIELYANGNDTSISVKSPSGQGPIVKFSLEDGVPYYEVTNKNFTLVEKSKLGINTSIGDLGGNFTVSGIVESSNNTTWNPLVGEQSEYKDKYNQIAILLKSGELSITLEIRAYDTGIAFRYVLPKSTSEYKVTDEYTQFKFPEGTIASVHEGGNQTVPKKKNVESLTGTYRRPLTLQYTTGMAMTICEGNLDNYPVMDLAGNGKRTLKSKLTSQVTVKEDDPKASPWRVLVIGNSDIELPQNANIVMNLNEAPDEETYKFSEWVEPGSCVRAASGLNNKAISQIIDEAAEMGIKYVLLDSGWYGPEYDNNCDPRLDPSKLREGNASDDILKEKYFGREGEGKYGTGEGIFNTRGIGFHQYKKLGESGTMQVNVDIPTLCDYANSRGVGIILYVNVKFFPDSQKRFATDELFDYFEKWGVAGVKPGFVNRGSQSYEKYMQEVIESAARHHLIMTIHDEYVTTGIERTYPNLFCTEGILGDEGIGKGTNPQAAEDIATLFTRTIQGPADHTFCFPGKASKVYALASPIMFRTGMSVIYWYSHPKDSPEEEYKKMGFWKDLPGTWDETLYLEGSMYEYATYARRSDETWYIASLSAIDRELKVDLNFLETGKKYKAIVYTDGEDADPRAGWGAFSSSAKGKQSFNEDTYVVDNTTELKTLMKYGLGFAAKLTPATEEEIESLPVYNPDLELLLKMIDKADNYKASSYRDNYTEEMDKLVEEATAVANDVSSTSEDFNEQINQLKGIYDALDEQKHVDEIVQSIDATSSYMYSEESWNKLIDAMSECSNILEKVSSAEDISAAREGLSKALEGLVITADKNSIYISDLDYDTERSYSWRGNKPNTESMIFKDRNRAGNKIQLIVDGAPVNFDKGMAVDAPGELYYNIENVGAQFFEAKVGVDAEKPVQGNVIFRVYGDGKLLYQSKASGTGSNESQTVNISVKGVKELRLSADDNGSIDGDWADWADAKLTWYKNPDALMKSISVEGKKLADYTPLVNEYTYVVENEKEVPQVTAVPETDDVKVEITQAKELPGVAVVKATEGTKAKEYKINIEKAVLREYLSDLPDDMIEENTLHAGTVFKDKCYKGTAVELLDSNGEWTEFKKGVGIHANTNGNVIYNISDLNASYFRGYVGISKSGDSRSKAAVNIYVDGKQAFSSGEMTYSTPKQYFCVDVKHSKTLRIETDPISDKSADHINLGDAKFVITQSEKDNLDEALDELNQLIETASEKEEDAYKPSTWDEFAEALDNAKQVASDKNASQQEIAEAKAALEKAMEALAEKADKAALEDAIDEADVKAEADYTPKTWEPFKKALDEAKKVAENDEATQEEVNNAEKQLKEKMDGLQKASQEGLITPPEITKGAEQVVKQGAPAEFTSNAEYDDFINVTVDNRVVSPKLYTVKEGSTKVTLSGDFTKGLSLGKHSFAIESENGKAETTFTVVKANTQETDEQESAETGDSVSIAPWLTLFGIALATFISMFISVVRKKQ